MSGRLILGVCLALLPTLAGAVEEPDPLHDPVPQPGVHPRLMFRAGAELEAAQTKVSQGTMSRYLIDRTANFLTQKINLSAPTDLPDYSSVIHASQPMLAQLDPDVAERAEWARSAINTSLKLIQDLDPPYPDFGNREWSGRFAYRYIALTYDNCYADMSDD